MPQAAYNQALRHKCKYLHMLRMTSNSCSLFLKNGCGLDFHCMSRIAHLLSILWLSLDEIEEEIMAGDRSQFTSYS